MQGTIMIKKYLYKFLNVGLRSSYDGSHWLIGEWRSVAEPMEECIGLNASEYVHDALCYVSAPILAKVECAGKIIRGFDKWTCEKMRIVAVADWTREHSIKLAVFMARLVLIDYERKHPEDDRPRRAIEAAEAVLGTDTRKAARSAVFDAAASAVASAVAASDPAARASAYASAYAAHSAYTISAGVAVASVARYAFEAAHLHSAGYAAAARRRINHYCLSIAEWKPAQVAEGAQG